ncbi:hypothetical protein EVA_21693, partial [gut metagenome]
YLWLGLDFHGSFKLPRNNKDKVRKKTGCEN